ncbi:MAG TPA: polysaccharide deacetylase family protein [Micromonosporaceae bacterium]
MPGRRLIATLLALLTIVTVTACAGDAPFARWRGGGGAGGALAAGDNDSGEAYSTPPPAPPAPASLLARLPVFGPAPAPEPITVPDGPFARFFHKIPTRQPVAFLTIDDGWVQRPEALALLRASHIPVTLFLISPVAAGNPAYFRGLQASGAVIEAHTLTHPSLRGKSYALQHHEICGSVDQLGTLFGRRPDLFRPPFGEYDQTTLRAAHDCGIRAVFYWTETVDKGIVRYQTPLHRVQPGDIILMHFRPAYADDFIAALNAIHQAGLTPALLEDYIA